MSENERKWWRGGTAVVVWIAVGTVVVHLATGWRYGFDRDELMALDDARNLAWGYVQYPPMTAFFGWVALKLFGTSLGGFRLFAAVAQAVALVLTGLMAKENGGSKWAMVVAALAGVPFCLGAGALMSYISFDYVCWAWVAYCVVRVVGGEKQWREEKKVISNPLSVISERRNSKSENRNSEEGPKIHPQKPRVGHPQAVQEAQEALLEVDSEPAPFADGAKSAAPEEKSGSLALLGMTKGGEKWWVGVGVGMGMGMLAKYTMGFFVVGVVVGVLATEVWKYLRSVWLWVGVALAWVIFLPNLVWEWRRNFVSLDFLRFLHARDVATGVTDWFLLGQLELTMLMAPLALAGVWFCLFSTEGKRWRILGWMYMVPLVLLVVMRGRDYYLAPAYPMLYAAGAVWAEKKSERVKEYKSVRGAAGIWRNVIWVALAVDIVAAGAMALPIAPIGTRWWKLAAKVDVVFPDEIGWPEFVEGVAKVRDGLPAEQRAHVGILAGNYGEVGALNLYGEKYGLPRAISGVNSSWERGYGDPPDVLIVVGYPRNLLEQEFASCVVGGKTRNPYGIANEETLEDPNIFVCRGLKESWEVFWVKVRKFA